MERYDKLSDNDLMEVLSIYTTKYTSLLSIGSDSVEQKKCKNLVDQIVKEIARRKKGAEKKVMSR